MARLPLVAFAVSLLCAGPALAAIEYAQAPPPPQTPPPCPSALRGAARGAAGGAAIGAIAGDAGKGAAIGAGIRGVGRVARNASARSSGQCY